MNKYRIAVLIGGNGSNFQAIVDYSQQPGVTYEVIACISHNPNAFGLQRAQNAGIPTFIVDAKAYESRVQFDHALQEVLKSQNADWIAMAGFMRILSADFIESFRNKIINIHPSLLPLYKGLNTHQRVLDAGDKRHGCSVHMVIPELDSGDIIAQCSIDVSQKDSVQTLQSRVHKAEHWLYPKVLQWFAEGKLCCHNNSLMYQQELLPPQGLQFSM